LINIIVDADCAIKYILII